MSPTATLGLAALSWCLAFATAEEESNTTKNYTFCYFGSDEKHKLVISCPTNIDSGKKTVCRKLDGGKRNRLAIRRVYMPYSNSLALFQNCYSFT